MKERSRLNKLGPLLAVGLLAAALGYLLGRAGGASEDAESGERGAQTGAEHAHRAEDDPDSADPPQSASVWTCAMHPQIRRDEPGSCPICGMNLVPATRDLGASGDTHAHVTLSERARALARVRTTLVQPGTGGQVTQRLLGRVETDESLLSTVTTWIGGRIERLHVRVTGEAVRRGQTIATLYSPEVYAAHQDLLSAKRQLGRLAQASPEARSAAESAVDATRERLRLLGITERALAAMEASSRPQRHVSIHSPFAGTIIARVATEGMTVVAGSPLYQVADLSRVWVQLEAYERDLPSLSVGQRVRLTVDALPDEVFVGSVAFIDPVLDARRRIARVRVVVENDSGALRPGMFAQGSIESSEPSGVDGGPLVIPASAALFTGRRSVVYVELPATAAGVEGDAEGAVTYAATVVRLGPRRGDIYPVLAGLQGGERVVTEGAFAIDADLQIRGGRSMMTQGDDREPGADDDPMSAPADFLVQLAPVMDAYLDLQAALAGDDLGAATRAAAALGASTRAVAPSSSATTNAAWNAIAGHLRAHSDQASAAEQLGTARTAFYPLSEQVERLVRVFGNPSREPLQLMHCPMAHDGDGASWLQRGDAVANPYYGPSMLTCGASALSLPVADTAAPPPPPVRRPSRATRAASPRMAPTRMAPAGMAPPGMSTASPTAHPPGHHH